MRSETKTVSPWIALVKGVLASVAASLAGIFLFALALKVLTLSDTAIAVINQLIKALSIALGTYIAVGKGGEKGFLKGAAVGLAYSVVGLALYLLSGGELAPALVLLGDIALGTAIGAAAGILTANLKPSK